MPTQRPPGSVTTSAPLERAAELSALESVVAGAVEGTGGLVVVEGPAGIGKSRLIAEMAASAEFLGARTLRARGTELERSFAFGGALQLFEPAVASLTPEHRSMILRGAAALADPLLRPEKAGQLPGPTHEFSVIHGLYWLAANLAEDRPLLLVVDDAHWLDEPSLQVCGYLARRIAELPIALVIAMRPSEPPPAGELLDAICALPHAVVLRPAPLSPDGVRSLTAAVVGREPDARFVATCEELTGGNPYLLTELLGAAAGDGLQATAEDAERLTQLAPEGVLRAVATRLAALPDVATSLARAAAVLGDDANLRHAAALAGIELDTALEVADRLSAADVLRPGEPLVFCHPLIAAAVGSALPARARGQLHLRAAELLREDGAAVERIATHLLAAPATGSAWVVDALRRAAERALAFGAPAIAVAALRRALAEPPQAGDRRELLMELGRAEARAGEPTAPDRLAEAARLADEPAARAQTLRELGRARLHLGDHQGAQNAYAEARAAIGGDDLELGAHLQAEELVLAAIDPTKRPDPETVTRLLARDDLNRTAGGRALLATLAATELYAGAPRDRVLPLADRALAGGAVWEDAAAGETTVFALVLVLFICEELSRCEELCTRLIDDTRRAGAVMALASASYSRIWARLIAGNVNQAAEDAQQAIDAGNTHGWQLFLAGAHAALTHALLDAGDVAAAEEQVRQAAALEGAADVTSIQILDARGRVHAARGRHSDAAADFLRAGDMAAGQHNPLLYATWRSNAGMSLAKLGERDKARELVEAELELAHAFGAPRGLSVALRALGTIEGGKLGLDLLRQSIDVLDGSEAQLELMRSQAEYGAALRRAGKRTEAGKVLGDALERARALGAGAVEKRAAAELEVAGTRAEKAARRGRHALSPGERRVVQLAVTGLSNREIAEELFVTRKAVEWHLSNAYGKLGINSRKELAEALNVEA